MYVGSAIRVGHWKYIWRHGGRVINALYNLDNDPMEKVNLSKKKPEMAAAMLDRLKDYRKNMSNVKCHLSSSPSL